uniref:AlNc14C6G898 protein n=1 Tax=Albugo laibachii Nc14 TaxID=890382 RepID=F0W1C9_9STRA|nr:AlNc14C6G898 [Albugo laibachii Nc14]|eukprot:CCA14857.1 AlNc14C6G898 [Albugo laibachii Nc14]
MLKSYIVFVLGVLRWKREFADAALAIRAYIHPILEFSDDGFLSKPIQPETLYTVRIIRTSEGSFTWMNSLKRCYEHASDALTSHLHKYRCKIPSIGKKIRVDISAPLLQKKSTADGPLNHAPTYKNDEWKLEDNVIEKILSGVNTIGWRLDGKSLLEWNQTKELNLNKISEINAQVFLKRNRGLHALRWTEAGGFRLFDRRPRFQRPDGGPVLESQLVANVIFEGVHNENQDIRVDFDKDATRIPQQFYDRIKEILLEYEFLEKNVTIHGQFKGPCTKVSKIPGIQTTDASPKVAPRYLPSIEMIFPNAKNILLRPEYYIARNGDLCTFLLEKSKDDTWVLGAQFLRANSITVHNTDAGIAYYFDYPDQIQGTSFA